MAKDKRGTEDQLAGLHGMLAAYFQTRLQSGEPLAPSELNTIRQFPRRLIRNAPFPARSARDRPHGCAGGNCGWSSIDETQSVQ